VLRGSKKHIGLAYAQIDQNNPEGLIEVIGKAAEETECLENKFEVLRFKASLQKYKDALIDYRQRLKNARGRGVTGLARNGCCRI